MKSVFILITAISFTINTSRVSAQNPVDFTLTSVTDGSIFHLSENKGKIVVLHFLLKTECPFCLRHTREYAVLSDSFPEVVQLFIKPDSREEILKWTESLEKSDFKNIPRIYIDPEAQLAKKYLITDGYKFHGQMVHYPALVVLDKNGKELFRYIGKNNADRYPAEKFKASVKEWQQ